MLVKRMDTKNDGDYIDFIKFYFQRINEFWVVRNTLHATAAQFLFHRLCDPKSFQEHGSLLNNAEVMIDSSDSSVRKGSPGKCSSQQVGKWFRQITEKSAIRKETELWKRRLIPALSKQNRNRHVIKEHGLNLLLRNDHRNNDESDSDS